ncbi:MAG: hypothetical protein IJB52_13700 [Clostridia bacterium]|nr:hypothetical protein [Clostridia bacterium]
MRHNRIFACLLAALLIAPGLMACSDSGTTETAADTGSAAVDTTENAETEEADPFAGFDYEGRDFRIWTSINAAAVSLGNSNYMIQGPEELTGDAAPDAAYERNLKVQELLNVTFQYEPLDNTYDLVKDSVQKYIMAGDNAYELIINDMYGTASLTLENMFYNALDGKYFDFSQPWWYDDFMSDVSINSNYQFMLGGDYFIDILRCSHCLFYNKSLYENIYGNADGMYDIVLEGDWTLERLNEIVEESYMDINGSGSRDIDDQYGYVSFQIWGSMIPFLISADPNYIDRDDRGYPYITMNNEDSLLLMDELYDLYQEGQGAWVANGVTEDLAVTIFTSGRAMFVGYQRLGSLENATVREMEDGLGVIPYPKLSDRQKNYITSTHDTCEIGLIPVTLAPTDLDYVSAVVEVLCRETYKSVLPVYYESSLKMKYTRDDTSAKMIDIVHDNIGNTFPMAYNPSLNYIFLSGTFCDDNIAAGKKDFASSYAKREPSALTNLEKIINDFEAKQGK